MVEHTVSYVFNWFPWENIGNGYSCNILPDISKKNNDKNSYLKTFTTVAQMCHCEAVELFAVLGDLPCFPTSAMLFWWVYNQYGQQKSLITISNVAQCPLPADGMRVMWLKKKNLTTLWLWLSLLFCRVWTIRVTQNISHSFFHFPAEWDVIVMTSSEQ